MKSRGKTLSLSVPGFTDYAGTEAKLTNRNDGILVCNLSSGRHSSLLHFRQCSSSNLHFRQFNGSKTRIVDKVGMRNLWVLIQLAAINCFQRRQRIGSSHSDACFASPVLCA